MDLRKYVRDIPNFPKPGVLFRDITPLLQSPDAFSFAISEMARLWKGEIDAIAALDARGFIFGSALAHELSLPFIPIRKKGKLPFSRHSVTYDLEYGTDTIEVHMDAFEKDARVLIVDDLLATGGTARAAEELVELAGAQVAGCMFVIELGHLGGSAKLKSKNITPLIMYLE